MIIDEIKFRRLCRTEYGRYDSEQFQKALDQSQEDPVTVTFETNLDEVKQIELSREECEFYAKIAKEEMYLEDELLKSINPRMHSWARMNRLKMCGKLKEAMELEDKVPGQGLIIIWPMCGPDQVGEDLANRYIKTYGPYYK